MRFYFPTLLILYAFTTIGRLTLRIRRVARACCKTLLRISLAFLLYIFLLYLFFFGCSNKTCAAAEDREQLNFVV